MTTQAIKTLIKSNRYLEQKQLRFINQLKGTISTDVSKYYKLILQNDKAIILNTNRLIANLMEQKLLNALQGFREDIKEYVMQSIKVVSISYLGVFKYVTQLDIQIDVMDSEIEIKNKIKKAMEV